MRARALFGAALRLALFTLVLAPAADARTIDGGSGLQVHGARRVAAHALAATDDECLPLVVTESVTLTADAPCGVNVEASEVTVDLGGHTVTGFIVGGCPMHLRNGIVRGAILSCGESLYEHLVVRDSEATGSPGIEAGFADVIRHNTFVYNDVAVDTFYGGDVRVAENTFKHNRLAVWSNDSGERIRANLFARNDLGISIFDEDDCVGCGGDHVIIHNLFRRNKIGVSIGALTGGQDNTIRDNVFDHNDTAGVRMQIDCATDDTGTAVCGGTGSVVDRNIFMWNGHHSTVKMIDDGFAGLSYVDGVLGGRGLRGVTVSRNIANHNFDFGLQAPRAHDGGGNHASRNGDARQCLGVRCT